MSSNTLIIAVVAIIDAFRSEIFCVGLTLFYVSVVHLNLKCVWRNGTGFILVSPLKETQASVLIFPRCSLLWLNTALQEKTKPLWMLRVFLRIQRWQTVARNWCVHSHILRLLCLQKSFRYTFRCLICRINNVLHVHHKYTESDALMEDLMNFWSMCLELNPPVGDRCSCWTGLWI